LVGDCHDCTFSVPLGIQDPDVGWSRLVVQCSVDCRRNILVHHIGPRYTFISSEN
jgi:hypothetical protein